MNTKTDETLLARWLEDDLSDHERGAVEAELRGDAEMFTLREKTRAMRRDIAALIPAREEPPYAEFFNERLRLAMRRVDAAPAVAAGSGWGRWWMPLGAAAGMALAFWGGTLSHTGREVVVQQPKTVETVKLVNEPGLYTPERGVDAEWFTSEEAAATVIVLSGVDAIPDDTDFSDATVQAASGEGTQVKLEEDPEEEVGAL